MTAEAAVSQLYCRPDPTAKQATQREQPDLGVKQLAGCQRLVLLDKVDDVEGHLIISHSVDELKVVAAPRDIAEAIVNDCLPFGRRAKGCRHDVNVLFEYGGRVDSERGAGLVARQRLHGVEVEA